MNRHIIQQKDLSRYAAEIYTYKCMLSIAYQYLSSKAQDEISENLLSEISTNEKNDAYHWIKVMQEITNGNKVTASPFLKKRVRFMMLILGDRSFIEWVLIAEDDRIEEMSILAANIEERRSDYLVRVISDERLHINLMKKEILGMEAWEMEGSGGVRDLIFGANDGLVSILALVAGVYGAVTDSTLILVTGVAAAIAGTISMGAGAYLSAKSEKEVTQRENRRKGILSGTHQQQVDSLVEMYKEQGFGERESRTIAERVTVDAEFQAQQPIGIVTGLTTEEDWPPSKAGLLTGISFMIASIIPLLPFALFDVTPAAISAMFASISALFGIGAIKAVFTRSSWERTGIENLIIGVIASTATFVIGKLMPGI